MALGQQMAQALKPQGDGAAAAPAAPAGPPPVPGAAPSWFLAVGGQQVGPVVAGDLAARVASGELTPATLVWRQGMAAWTAASDVPELGGMFAASPPPVPPAPPAPPQA
jgi:hypothetical protein